jgi:hypothetical protein
MPIDESKIQEWFPEDTSTGDLDIPKARFDRNKADSLFAEKPSAAVSRAVVGVDPAQASRQAVLANKHGVQPQTVKTLPEDIEAMDLQKQIDASPPVVRSALSRIEFAEQAKNDIENLSWIEKAVTNLWPSIKESAGQGLRGFEAAALDSMSNRISGMDDPEFRGQGGADFIGVSSDKELQQLKDSARTTLYNEIMASNERVAEMTPQNLDIIQQGIRSGLNSLALQAPGFIATLATRNPAPMLYSMSGFEGLSSYGEARSEGKGIGQSAVFGGTNALIEFVTEKIPTGALVDSMGPNWKKALADFAVGELLGEQAATFTQSLNAVAHDLDEQMAQATTLGEKARIQAERQAVTVVSTFVAGGSQITVARGIGELQSRIRGGENDQQRLMRMDRAIENSELRKNNPALFRQLLEKMGKSSNVETVYLDPDQASVYFQSGQIPEELFDNPTMQLIRDDVEKALEEGRFVEIPLSAYPEIVGTEFHTAMQQHMKLDPDSLTAGEAFNEDIQQRIDNLVAMDEEQRQANNEVYNAMLGQMLGNNWDRSTAESHAILYEATFQALAERPGIKAQGLTAFDLYNRFNPTVNRQLAPEVREKLSGIEQIDTYLDRLRAGDVPREADMFGASMVDFIREQGGLNDEGGELSARDAGRSLIRKDGRSLDDMAEQLVEAGYITERSEAALLEALDKELRGDRVYALGAENTELMDVNQTLNDLDQLLREAGLDLNDLTNEQVKAAIQEVVDGDVLSQDEEAAAGILKLGGKFGKNIIKKGDVNGFMDELYALTKENPINPAERLTDNLAGIEVSPWGDGVHIGSVVSYGPKGSGIGTSAMKLVTQLADKHGVTLTAIVSPIKNAGSGEGKSLTKAQLHKWYKSQGFEKGNGDSIKRAPLLYQPGDSTGRGDVHRMEIERLQRELSKKTTINIDEKSVISKAVKEAKSAGIKGVTNKLVTNYVRAIKAQYPPESGWAPMVLKTVEVKQGKNGKFVIKPEFVPITYSFNQAEKSEMVDALVGVYRELEKRKEDKDANAEVILRQSKWYTAMRDRLREEFGSLGDLFADLLGATSPKTPVAKNWEGAIDALRNAVNGKYDSIIDEVAIWAEAVDRRKVELQQYIDAEKTSGRTLASIKKDDEFKRLNAAVPLTAEPLKSNGKKFGTNTTHVAKALGDMWRMIDTGSAPKARNFSGNLIGFTDEATIDVWAARLLQFLSGQKRIPPRAETAVDGSHLTGSTLEDPKVGGNFGFGQDVFREAANRLDMRPSDLQAVVWFYQKEIWSRNNWTTMEGEGGSFEEQADKNPVDRFVGMLSVQQSAANQGVDVVPTDTTMADYHAALTSAMLEDSDVALAKSMSTLGRYGSDERSFDIEFIAQQGTRPNNLWQGMLDAGKESQQDALGLSRVVQPGEDIDPLFHRPGMEIYFHRPTPLTALTPLLEKLEDANVQYFTFSTDGRRTQTVRDGGMGNVVGLRILYVPEFSEDPAALLKKDDNALLEKMKDEADKLDNLRDGLQDMDGIAYADVLYYESRVVFREEYDNEITGSAEGAAGEASRPGWRGRSVREGLEAANRRSGVSGANRAADSEGNLYSDGQVVAANQSQGAPGVLYQSNNQEDSEALVYQPDDSNPTRLSALHNLTSDNLIFADDMGGLAVPSIGIVKEDMSVGGYGEITLIGTDAMGNPKSVPIYDSDAYTSTFPRPEYPATKTKIAQSLVDQIKPWVTKYEGKRGYVIDATWDYSVNNPNPKNIIQEWARSNGVKAMFLYEQGSPNTRVVMQDVPLGQPESRRPEIVSFFKAIDHEQWRNDNEQQRKELTAPLRKAFADTYAEIRDAEFMRDMLDRYIDENGYVRFGVAERLYNDQEKIGKKQVDVYATADRLDKKLKGKEVGFQSWINERVMEMFGDPYLKIGRKKLPYTLPNIVEQMTKGGTQAREAGLTFGEGKARATAAKSFDDLQTMRNYAEWQLLSEDEVSAGREKTKETMEAYRNAVLDYYQGRDWRGNIDTWGGLDASMEAVAFAAKNQAKMGGEKALRKGLLNNDFKAVPNNVIQMGVEATEAMMAAPLPYFEAKPERVVSLNEFVGAVVPNDVDQKVLDVFDKHNIAYVKYGKRYDEDARRKSVIKLRNKLDKAGAKVLFQNGSDNLNEGKSGPGGFFDPKTNRITLTPNADLSTFLHESAHFFLEVMRELAPMDESLQADLAILEKWWVDNDANDFTKRHEMFASGMETYWMEGKAPIPELQPLFTRFSMWLGMVYKKLTGPFRRNNLDVQLSDEVRGVMDRLVASQDAIDAAKQQQDYGPINYEQLGLSPEDAAALQTLVMEADDEARRELTTQVMRELQRERTDWWKKQAAEKAKGIAEELDQQPEYLARDFLSGDRIPEGQVPFKLNLDYIRDIYGKTAARRFKNMAAKDGMHPDLAAPLLGYSSGDALVRALLGTKNKGDRAKYVKALATEDMRAEHGDMLTDGTLAEEAQSSVHNDKQAELLLAELRLLNRIAGNKQTPRQLFKAAAERTVAETPIYKLRPDVHKRNETKARNAAMKAAVEGDAQKAALESHRALRQFYLYRESLAAKQAAEKLGEYGRSFRGKKMDRIRKAGDHYKDQVAGILEKFEFRVISGKAIARRQSMREWIEQTMAQAGEGNPFANHSVMTKDEAAVADLSRQDDAQSAQPDLGITDAMLVEAGTRNYRTLTLPELEAVGDALRAIEHLSRLKNKLLTQAEKRKIDDWVNDLVASIENKSLKKVGATSFGSTLDNWESIKRKGAAFRDISRQPTSLIKMLDGYDDDGIAWRLLGQPMQEAAAEETVQLHQANIDIQELYSIYSAKDLMLMNHKVADPRLGRKIDRHSVVAILMNYGNPVNKQRILDGMGLTEEMAQSLMDTYLTEKDYQFAKAAWAYLDTFKKAAFDLHKDLFGFTPEEVEAVPFETKYGTMPGGYFPIQYDPEKSAAADQHALTNMLQPQVKSIQSKAKQGSTQARVARVVRPMKTDVMQIISQHVADTIHHTTHDRALFDVGRILSRDSVKTAITENYGPHIYTQFTDLVRELKDGGEKPRNMLEALLMGVRNNATLATLGASLRTITLQPFGVTNSIVAARLAGIGTHRLMNSYAEFYRHLPTETAKIREESVYMRHREQVMSTAISRIKNKIQRKGQIREITELTMIPIMKSQFYTVDAPLYMAARDHYLSSGMDEKKAIGLAEQVVREAQGGGGIMDTAQGMRGHPVMKIFTNFLTYTVTTWNLQVKNFNKARRGEQNPFDFTVNMFVALTVPAILNQLLGLLTRGGGDDDEDFSEKVLREQISFLLSANPATAQLSGGIQGYDYKGPQGLAIINQIGNAIKQTQQGEPDDAFFKAWINVAGLATGLPSTQINRTIFGLKQAAEENDDPLTTVKKAAFGPEYK